MHVVDLGSRNDWEIQRVKVFVWQVSFAKQSCRRAARILAPRFGALASVSYEKRRTLKTKRKTAKAYEETKWHDIAQYNIVCKRLPKEDSHDLAAQTTDFHYHSIHGERLDIDSRGTVLQGI